MTCAARPAELIDLARDGCRERALPDRLDVNPYHFRCTVLRHRPEISYTQRLARAEYRSDQADRATTPDEYAHALRHVHWEHNGAMMALHRAITQDKLKPQTKPRQTKRTKRQAP